MVQCMWINVLVWHWLLPPRAPGWLPASVTSLASCYSVFDLACLPIPLYPDLLLLTLACILTSLSDFFPYSWFLYCCCSSDIDLGLTSDQTHAFWFITSATLLLLSLAQFDYGSASCPSKFLCYTCASTGCKGSSLSIHIIPTISRLSSDHPLFRTYHSTCTTPCPTFAHQL